MPLLRLLMVFKVFSHGILKSEMNLKCERAALKHLEEGILILAALNLQTTWERNLII